MNLYITWDAEPRDLAADPSATIGLDRAAWTDRGARFTSYDDGLGRSPQIATGVVETAVDDTAAGARWQIPFGIQDFGGETTFLLTPMTVHAAVPASAAARAMAANIVIGALAANGYVDASDVLERLPANPAADLEARVDRLERRLVAVSRTAAGEDVVGDDEPLALGAPGAAPRALPLWVKAVDDETLVAFLAAVAALPIPAKVAGTGIGDVDLADVLMATDAGAILVGVGVGVDGDGGALAQRLETPIWNFDAVDKALLRQRVFAASATHGGRRAL